MVVRVQRSERGVSLMETLVALFILSVVGVAVIAGIYTTVKANELVRTRITAESLARTELEYVSSQPMRTEAEWTSGYTLPATNPTYPPGWDATHTMPTGYVGYSITVTPSETVTGDDADAQMSTKQKITAVVTYNTVEVFSINMYLAER